MPANFIITIVAILIIVLVLKVVVKSTKILVGVLVNSLIGAVILWILGLMSVPVTINWWSALLAGALGVPGVILVLILQLVLKIG